MTANRSSRYDFGACDVAYVTESDFYSNVTIRFRQTEGGDEAQVILTKDTAHTLMRNVFDVLAEDSTALIPAQLSGQKMAAVNSGL